MLTWPLIFQRSHYVYKNAKKDNSFNIKTMISMTYLFKNWNSLLLDKDDLSNAEINEL